MGEVAYATVFEMGEVEAEIGGGLTSTPSVLGPSTGFWVGPTTT